MKAIFTVVFLVGIPLYLWNQATAGTLDTTQGLGLALIWVLIVGGLAVRWRYAQARMAERDFWLSQRR